MTVGNSKADPANRGGTSKDAKKSIDAITIDPESSHPTIEAGVPKKHKAAVNDKCGCCQLFARECSQLIDADGVLFCST